MPGFATGEHTKGNAWRLMHALGVTAHEIDIRPAARQMLADIGHPFARGEPVYDVTFENVQAGLRTDYLFRLANQHGGIVLGTGDLSELALGWCTYGVGDQMSHYNVNAGVPKTLIQHLIRWVIGSGQFDADVSDDAAGDPRHRDLARAGPGRRGRGAAEHRGEGRPLRAAGLQPVLHAALRLPAVEDRLPGLHAWERCRRAAPGRPAFPPERRRAYDLAADPAVAAASSCSASSASASSSARPCPTARRSRAGGSLSPRGDWRAPSDGNARVWLDELERERAG